MSDSSRSVSRSTGQKRSTGDIPVAAPISLYFRPKVHSSAASEQADTLATSSVGQRTTPSTAAEQVSGTNEGLTQKCASEMHFPHQQIHQAVSERTGKLRKLDQAYTDAQQPISVTKASEKKLVSERHLLRTEWEQEAGHLFAIIEEREQAQQQLASLKSDIDKHRHSWMQEQTRHTERLEREGRRLSDMGNSFPSREQERQAKEADQEPHRRNLEAAWARRSSDQDKRDRQSETDHASITSREQKLVEGENQLKKELAVLADYKHLKETSVNSMRDELLRGKAEAERRSEILQEELNSKAVDLDNQRQATMGNDAVVKQRDDLIRENQTLKESNKQLEARYRQLDIQASEKIESLEEQLRTYRYAQQAEPRKRARLEDRADDVSAHGNTEGISDTSNDEQSADRYRGLAIQDVRHADYQWGVLPATVQAQLYKQIAGWDARRATWVDSDEKRCAESFVRRVAHGVEREGNTLVEGVE